MQLRVLQRAAPSCAVSRRAVASAPLSLRVQRNRCERRHIQIVRSAEEVAQQAESAAAAEAPTNGAVAPALERARLALESEDLDRIELGLTFDDLEAELGSLRAQLREAEEKLAAQEGALTTSKDQLIRLTADFENFRRRSANEKATLKDKVRGEVVTSLLPLVDNFELARTQVKVETEAEQKINNSYQSLYRQMVEVMRQLGVEAVPTAGELFDPNIHEAIMRLPNNDVPEGSILTEFRKGFRLGDTLLRPALVQVSYVDESAAPAEPADEAVDESAGSDTPPPEKAA